MICASFHKNQYIELYNYFITAKTNFMIMKLLHLHEGAARTYGPHVLTHATHLNIIYKWMIQLFSWLLLTHLKSAISKWLYCICTIKICLEWPCQLFGKLFKNCLISDLSPRWTPKISQTTSKICNIIRQPYSKCLTAPTPGLHHHTYKSFQINYNIFNFTDSTYFHSTTKKTHYSTINPFSGQFWDYLNHNLDVSVPNFWLDPLLIRQ